jgi:GH18 family chitinase
LEDQIDITNLTHLNFAFASIDPTSFNITPVDPEDFVLYPQFTNLKTEIMQTWIAIGGFSFSDPGPTFTTWSDMVSNYTARCAFIASLVAFMDQWGFQGVDLDWEYPAVAARGGTPEDTANLVSLLQQMRETFGWNYGISVVL